MAIQTIPQTPLFQPVSYTNGSLSTVALNSTDDWMAKIIRWPGGDLTKCAFYVSAVSGSPVVTVQLFNVDPTDGGSSPVNTSSAIGSAVDSATLTVGPVTVSGIGQTALAAGIYAIRLIFKSGTSATIGRWYTNSGLWGGTQIPYVVTVADGGAQTKAGGTGVLLALGASTFVPVMGCLPPVAHTSVSFQDTSNPDEHGLWFTNPFPVDIRICGVGWANSVNTRPDIRINYYTGTLGSPTAALTMATDRDVLAISTAGGNYIQFDTKQTLAAGASAGIGLRSTTTHNQGLVFWDFLTGNQALMDMWWGQSATLFTREADAGALTQTTFRTPLIYPFIDGVDSGGAGGSPIARPGLHAIGQGIAA